MKNRIEKKRKITPKPTTPKCVEMMRAIRTALFADYLKNPALMKSDLENIRKQYGLAS
ncbi:MAG TPA: hypothetical protein PKH10_02695 [bacterium]|nr:hypothetical protein [bacterium]